MAEQPDPKPTPAPVVAVQASKQTDVLVEVVLLRQHSHDGQPAKAGDTIKVSAAQASWLHKHGAIAPPTQTGDK